MLKVNLEPSGSEPDNLIGIGTFMSVETLFESATGGLLLIFILTNVLLLVVPLLSLTVYVKLSEPEYSLSGVYFTVSPDTDDN